MAPHHDALAALIERHQERIWTLAYHFSGRCHDADDVTEEAILRIWRSAGRYGANGRFETWLHRVVTNLCMDGIRRQRRRRRLAAREAQRHCLCEPDPLPSEQRELRQRVRRAIRALPRRQRLAVVLHRYRSLSHHQIAEATGWTEPAVESLLVRAYAALRMSLHDLRDK